MMRRDYYSVRTGKIQPDPIMDLEVLKTEFLIIYNKLNQEGYFQEYFGIDCTNGFIEGLFGNDIEAIMFINLKKHDLYPIPKNLPNYCEDDLFDVLEFLYDHCSKGLTGEYHDWYQCGYHYNEFSDMEGKKYFRDLINPMLNNFNDGYEISENGEILILANNGLSNLFKAEIPTNDKDNVANKINAAILKFRRCRSTLEERKEAIRELSDVLEFLRPQIKFHLDKKDENDLFNLANNFGIRHHNVGQKTAYDKAIWYSWIFYYYLATLHAVLRMIKDK